MMKFLRILGIMASVLGVAGLLGSVIARQVYGSRAQLIQRVDPVDPNLAALTGDEHTPIGEPQILVINDPKAFLESTGPQGSRLVDDAYLKKQGIYPLQLKTVTFVTGLIMMASGISAAIGIGMLLMMRRKCASACATSPHQLTEEQ